MRKVLLLAGMCGVLIILLYGGASVLPFCILAWLAMLLITIIDRG